MTTVVCLKLGEKYGPEYVNRLHEAVQRYTTIPHRFVCLTDDSTGVECECLPAWTDFPGWWGKLLMFDPHGPLLGERKLYLDLDTVIVGNIDPLLAYEGKFCAVKDWWAKGYNGSVYAIEAGFGAHLYQNFRLERDRGQFYSDQEYLTVYAPGADYWQFVAPGLIGSYKANSLEAGPRNFKLICFHGIPKPHDFAEGWVAEAWRGVHAV